MAIDRMYDLDEITDELGTRYGVRVLGSQRPDGKWDALLEFRVGDRILLTPRETTQPNEADLAYWATGLSRVYLDGALHRATDGTSATPLASER